LEHVGMNLQVLSVPKNSLVKGLQINADLW
jgi:hypothetical protein